MQRHHHENFPVASWLCPPHLRPAIMAIYRFARTADDLADEGKATTEQRLQQLQAYRMALLHATSASSSPEAIVTAPSTQVVRTAAHAPMPCPPAWRDLMQTLAQTLAPFAMPVQLLLDLLDAFEQDVRDRAAQRGCANRDELLRYCQRSANPIGRMLLRLYGIQEQAAFEQSDAICSALQIINFWQDLSVDRSRGHHHVPTNEARARDWPGLLRWPRELMHQGMPLCWRLPGRAAWELRLVIQGGLRVLDKIERLGPRIAHQRPRLHMGDTPVLLWRSWHMPRPAVLDERP